MLYRNFLKMGTGNVIWIQFRKFWVDPGMKRRTLQHGYKSSENLLTNLSSADTHPGVCCPFSKLTVWTALWWVLLKLSFRSNMNVDSVADVSEVYTASVLG
jgi:hypothetical protein